VLSRYGPTVTEGPAYSIESVDRALSVILAFEETDTLTITEIGRQLGVSRSTAYRLLSVLEQRGFVRQDRRTKAFHGGSALLRVGLAASRRSDIRAELRPVLEKVVADVDETAHVVTLDRGEALFIDCVESTKTIRASSRIGTSLPAYVTASGKVLLGNLPREQLDAILAGDLRRVGGRRISAASVRRELAKVRSQGWALNDGESEVGLRAVAVLIDGSATQSGHDAAITVAAPASRLDDARVEKVSKVLKQHIAAFAATGA
jgi:IclR family transcriptional regulator, acetate operon repressor